MLPRTNAYAGRYARRPPIAQHRFRTITRQEIRFVTKDTRTKRTVETTYTPAAFLATLADHVPDRYRHNIRYFGLLAPRVKCQTHDAVFALLGQERLGKPRRLRWATSIQKCFGVDPLMDRDGQRMRWPSRSIGSPWSQVADGAGTRHELTSRHRRSELICCPRARTLPAVSDTFSLQRFDAPRRVAPPAPLRVASPEAPERGNSCTRHRAPADHARLGPERTWK